MSFVDKVLDSLSDIDLKPIEKYSSKKYHQALGAVQGIELPAVGKYAHDAYDSAGNYLTRTRRGEPDYLRGFVAGMIGGIIGTGVKMLIDRSLPTAQPAEEHDARLQLVEGAEELIGTDMNRNREEVAQQALNIGFGAIVGGIYGVIIEAAPSVAAPAGIPFGAALWTLAHKVALPALGLTPGPLNEPVGLQAGQLGSHMAYGAAVEVVRRSVRHVMDEEDLL